MKVLQYEGADEQQTHMEAEAPGCNGRPRLRHAETMHDTAAPDVFSFCFGATVGQRLQDS